LRGSERSLKRFERPLRSVWLLSGSERPLRGLKGV
jgi:hypothetical protein